MNAALQCLPIANRPFAPFTFTHAHNNTPIFEPNSSHQHCGNHFQFDIKRSSKIGLEPKRVNLSNGPYRCGTRQQQRLNSAHRFGGIGNVCGPAHCHFHINKIQNRNISLTYFIRADGWKDLLTLLFVCV